MDDELQTLKNQREQLYNQINVLYNNGYQKREEYQKAQDIGDGEGSLKLYDEMMKIHAEIQTQNHLMKKIDDKIIVMNPPVKIGKLVDLRTADDSLRCNIYLHNQPIEVGKIEYRGYHCSEYIGDIGYVIKDDYRNHGYATEALSLLSEKLYEDGITDFWISVQSENVSSIKVIEKNGGKLLRSDRDPFLYVVPTKLRDLSNGSEQQIRPNLK